ncbi:MAG: universal stress protein [Pseudomonadota bacterium]
MSYARILGQIKGEGQEAHASGSPDRAVLQAALTLAKAFEADLRILHVALDPAQALPLLGEGMTGAMASSLSADLTQLAKSARIQAETLVQEVCQDQGITLRGSEEVAPAGRFSVGFEQAQGLEEEITIARARIADLSVLAHPGADEALGNPTAEAVLFNSGRPLLLAPLQGMTAIPNRMAVAWNGSAEAARAVALAMPLLRKAEEVIVISGESDKAAAEAQPSALAELLDQHGMNAKTWRYQPEDWPVSRSLIQEARKSGAGLLVMGGYGHSRVREVFLGGATREAFKAADLALLMAH